VIRAARRIDVHHHVIPPVVAKAMGRHGVTKVGGADLPRWTARASIRTMDLYGVQTAVTSLSAPGVYFGDLAEACELARASNEFSARMALEHPGRFGWFAVLPMPFTAQACVEAVHALDVLKADGVVLLGSTEGVFLGDPRLDELMAELDRRAAVVFVHPNLHKTSTELDLATPGYLVEFLCDTTRAATNLILTGTLERYPRIRWILAHAGGFLPYIAWRLSLANDQFKLAKTLPRGMLNYIRGFYFDTALSPSPYAMAALRELVDPSHILFGSDYPFAPARAVGMQVKALESLRVFDPEDLAGINRDHALALFPRLASLPEPSPDGLGVKLRRALVKPVDDLAERIRDR
jgi:predicted TIM-barrel fold metal-dependent hydrolase